VNHEDTRRELRPLESENIHEGDRKEHAQKQSHKQTLEQMPGRTESPLEGACEGQAKQVKARQESEVLLVRSIGDPRYFSHISQEVGQNKSCIQKKYVCEQLDDSNDHGNLLLGFIKN
jgi:hypothetical protein